MVKSFEQASAELLGDWKIDATWQESFLTSWAVFAGSDWGTATFDIGPEGFKFSSFAMETVLWGSLAVLTELHASHCKCSASLSTSHTSHVHEPDAGVNLDINCLKRAQPVSCSSPVTSFSVLVSEGNVSLRSSNTSLNFPAISADLNLIASLSGFASPSA